MHALLHSVPPTLQQASIDPCLCQRLLDIHGQIWVSFLWGHCSFLPGPGVHKVICALQESVFPVLCKSWWLYDDFNGDLFQEGLCNTQVCCTKWYPKHPEPWLCTSPLTLYLHWRHSNTILSQFLLVLCVLVHSRFVWALWASLADMGFGSKCDFAPPTVLLGLGHGVSPHSNSSTVKLLL